LFQFHPSNEGKITDTKTASEVEKVQLLLLLLVFQFHPSKEGKILNTTTASKAKKVQLLLLLFVIIDF